MDFDDFDKPSQAPPSPSGLAPKSEAKVKSPSTAAPVTEKEVEGQSEAVVVEKMDVDEVVSTAAYGDSGVELKEEEKKTVSTLDELSLKIDGGAPEEDVAAEDCVVAEYDVYYNPPSSDSQLYVMQYPLRPSWRPYELEKRCTEVRLRPDSSMMEVDLTVDVESDNYDRDGPLADKMQKTTLSSSAELPYTATYAVGLLKGKKLYLNPIHRVVQLRPSMEYLDTGDLKKKNDIAAREEKEPWIRLNYHGPASDLAQTYLREMVTEESNSLFEITMKPSDYLNSLCPGPMINKAEPYGLPRRLLFSLPLEQRLKKLLVEGPHVLRFDDIKYAAAPDDPAEDVLKVVQLHASLVQGVWVSKSNVRCTSGIEKTVRDYVLFKFSQNPFMKYSELDFLKDKKSVVETVIPNIAADRLGCKGWEFIEPTDALFIKLYPNIVKRQSLSWQEHGKNLQEKLGLLRPSAYSVKDLGKSTHKARSLRPWMSEEVREALSEVLGRLFLTHKVCSIQKILQGLRDTAVSLSFLQKVGARSGAVIAVLKHVHAHLEDLRAIISEHAIDVHGLYVLKPSSEESEESEDSKLNPLRNVIIGLFRGKETGAAVTEGEIIEAFENEPATNDLQKVLNEYCVFKDGKWVLKSSDGILSNDWLSIFKAAKLL